MIGKFKLRAMSAVLSRDIARVSLQSSCEASERLVVEVRQATF